jgi:hypothetical protein
VSRVTRRIDNWIYWMLMIPQLQRTTRLSIIYTLYKALQNTLSLLSVFCLHRYPSDAYETWPVALQSIWSNASNLRRVSIKIVYCRRQQPPRSLSPCCGVLEHLDMYIAPSRLLWLWYLVLQPGMRRVSRGFNAHNFVKIAERGHRFTYEIVQIDNISIAGKWFTAEANLLPLSLSGFHYILAIQALI